jgi:hypothetical protein
MVQKKRRGRPPALPGSKTKPEPVVATRIAEKTLKRLEQAAAWHKRSLSREVRARLEYTLGTYQKGGINLPPHLQVLLKLVTFAAHTIEKQFRCRWHENRFTGRELVKAIDHIMVELSPDADDVIPPKVIENAKMHAAGKKAYLANPGIEHAKGIVAWFRLLPEEPLPAAYLPEAEFLQDFREIKRVLRRRHK